MNDKNYFMILLQLLLIMGDITPTTTTIVVAQDPQIQSIALYYSPKCPHSQKVLAYMRSQNISIPLKDVTVDAQAKEQLRIIGGHLIVPCLIVDGRPIYEDQSIIQWLSEHKATLSSNLPKS